MLPEYFAYLTILFGLIGTFLYIKDTLSGRNKPNKVSWILWAIAPLVGVYISYNSGISFPLLLSTFMAGFGPFLVVIASFFNKDSYWKISFFDIVCGIISIISIIIFLKTKDAFLSLSFAIIADLFAAIPTITKSWYHSETETAWPYGYGIINATITFLVIDNFSFLNYSFPLYIIIINLIIIFCIKRNKKNRIYLFNKEEWKIFSL